MVYVFDTSSFIVTGHYYPQQFPRFWEKFNFAVNQSKIISVREVYKELDNEASAPHLIAWINEYKSIFQIPDAIATHFTSTIFAVPHFQGLINDRSRLTGRPSADPFVIAVAKSQNGCVVTQEKEKPNAPKIPNVCLHFGIDCTDLQGFMEREGWSF